MTGEYWVLKYVDDIPRMEPRNVGVLLRTDQGSVAARFLGEREGGALDLRTVRGVVSHTATYRQWVEYWRYVLSTAETPQAAVKGILDSLRGNYVASDATKIVTPEASASQIVSQLFHALITEFPSPRTRPEHLEEGGMMRDPLHRRQYLVFGGSTYYPNGGWHDFRGRFDSLVEAERAAAANGDDWWHIVDAETGEFVASNAPKWER